MNKNKVYKNKLAALSLGLFLIDAIFFSSINSTKAPAAVDGFGFILLITSLFTLMYCLMRLINSHGAYKVKRPLRLAGAVTLLIGTLIALQSIGQLTQKDILVIVPLLLIGYVYFGYIKTNEQKIN